jgi:hypothetical protein
VHGINGNFFLNPETGEEVIMNDPHFPRANSILSLLAGGLRSHRGLAEQDVPFVLNASVRGASQRKLSPYDYSGNTLQHSSSRKDIT